MFLKTGMTLANLKIEGKFNFLMLKLKIWHKGMEIRWDDIFRNLAVTIQYNTIQQALFKVGKNQAM